MKRLILLAFMALCVVPLTQAASRLELGIWMRAIDAKTVSDLVALVQRWHGEKRTVIAALQGGALGGLVQADPDAAQRGRPPQCRLVQIEPGPMPILMASAPASITPASRAIPARTPS